MPFKSTKQRAYLEMIKNNPEKANNPVSPKQQKSITNFVNDAEKMPQPKIVSVSPKKKNPFGKLLAKIGAKTSDGYGPSGD